MLTDLSHEMADVVAGAAESVVQVQGRRRPASGLVYAQDVVVTTMRALGREDGIRVRRHDGESYEAELAGWDPATSLAALRVPGLGGRPLNPATSAVRVGHLVLAIARSWSNAVTASAGIVSVIGGPLATGTRRAIDQIIRTTAPMHDGFAGGALLDTSGGLLGVATAAEIRGLGVVIPAAIAWSAVAGVLKPGGARRGYLGLAGQPVALPESQRAAAGARESNAALLVVAVAAESPAARAGILVGDVILAFDGHPIESPEELLDELTGDRVGHTVSLQVLRGGAAQVVSLTVGERRRPSR
jgi:S1-C subfamily serine protease